MKHLLAGIILVVLSAGSSLAQEKKNAQEVTLKGEVIDVACYLAGEARGKDHVACARACAKAGGSLGLLTDDGNVYVSLLPDDHKNNPNHLLMDHIGHMVEAKGFVRAKGGVNGIMIKSVSMTSMKKM